MSKGVTGGLADAACLVFTVNGADLALAQQCTVDPHPGFFPEEYEKRPQLSNPSRNALCYVSLGENCALLGPFPSCKVVVTWVYGRNLMIDWKHDVGML